MWQDPWAQAWAQVFCRQSPCGWEPSPFYVCTFNRALCTWRGSLQKQIPTTLYAPSFCHPLQGFWCRRNHELTHFSAITAGVGYYKW